MPAYKDECYRNISDTNSHTKKYDLMHTCISDGIPESGAGAEIETDCSGKGKGKTKIIRWTW